MNIYTIMTMTKLEQDEKTKFPDFGSSSIVGYYFDMDKAFGIVKENVCDINETCYDYALIEEIREGLYQSASSDCRWFFKYDKDKDCYYQIEEPEFLKHYCGFTVG